MVAWAGLGAIALLVSACATASNPLTSTTQFDSLVPGWQSKYTLDWKAQPAQDGSTVLYGRISNALASSDRDTAVIGQRIEWVPGGVPGFNQVYFQIDHMVAAASYRVTVWDYTFIETRGTMP